MTTPDHGRRPLGLDDLGLLERRVMEVVWAEGREWPVRDIHARLSGLAYTTVMTTAQRLAEKGLLTRARRGRAFYYRAAVTRADLRWYPAQARLADLLRDDPRPVLSLLVETVSSRDIELLDELARLVRDRRRR